MNILLPLFGYCWGMTGLVGCFHSVEEVRPTENASDKTTQDIQHTNSHVAPAETDWPWWRGPQQDNHAAGSAPPIAWGKDENILWRADVPGRGHATPILWRDHLFVATAEEQGQTQSLLCYNRTTGNQEWQTKLHSEGWPTIHAKNSHASATPACDGEAVFTAFAKGDAIWISAVGLDGKILWQTEAGPFDAPHGYGSSPVIYKSFVLVQSDNKSGGFVAALDRKTGAIVWRIRRARNDSYGTPVVAHVAGRDQLLTSGQDVVVSYDPATGTELWRCAGPSEATANTMAFHQNLVIASGGYPEQNVLAIRADGSGDVTATHIAWSANFKMYVPSALIINDGVLTAGDNGVGVYYALADGKVLWKERVSSGAGFSASPVLVKDLVFVPDEKGVMHVLRVVGNKLEKVAQNDLDDGGMASPVIADERLYLRTAHALYCIGHTSRPPGTDPEEQ